MSRALETKDQEAESAVGHAIDFPPVQFSAAASLQSHELMGLSPDSALATDPAAAQAAELRAASGPQVQRQSTGGAKSASAPSVAAAGVEASD